MQELRLTTERYHLSFTESQHGWHLTQWSGQELVALQVEAVPASLSSSFPTSTQVRPVSSKMSEKKESYVEVGHGHLAEASESRTKYPTKKQQRKKNYSRGMYICQEKKEKKTLHFLNICFKHNYVGLMKSLLA